MSSCRSRRGGRVMDYDTQTIKQVLSELTVRYQHLQTFVRGGDYPYIQLDLLPPPDPPDLALLNEAQESCLQRWSDIPHFIQKTGAPISLLKEPFLVGNGPWKAPFIWPNSSLSKSVSANAPQSTTIKGRSALGLL